MGIQGVLYRLLVAFGAACCGLFVGMVGSAVIVIPLNLGLAVAFGLAVTGAVASLAVPVTQDLRR